MLNQKYLVTPGKQVKQNWYAFFSYLNLKTRLIKINEEMRLIHIVL